MVRRFIRLGLAAGLALTVAGCADYYDGNGYYGGGVAYPYYSGPVGYGAGYYGGIGYPSYGVYNDYYYPGQGIYVFDRGGRRREWNDDERRHFEYRGGGYRDNHLRENGRFDDRRDRAYAADRNAGLRAFRQGGGERGQADGRGGHPGGERGRAEGRGERSGNHDHGRP